MPYNPPNTNNDVSRGSRRVQTSLSLKDDHCFTSTARHTVVHSEALSTCGCTCLASSAPASTTMPVCSGSITQRHFPSYGPRPRHSRVCTHDPAKKAYRSVYKSSKSTPKNPQNRSRLHNSGNRKGPIPHRTDGLSPCSSPRWELMEEQYFRHMCHPDSPL